MKEINVGIIGFGFMGKTHTYGYKTIPLYYDNIPFKINLIGVCSRNIETANNAKEANGFEYATTDPSVIFNDKRINVINICTPNIYHKDAVISAIKSGKNIYCDKPLAISHEEAGEIIELLKGTDIIAQMALQNRFFPATLRAKELINEGRIGNILTFRSSYLHSGSVDKDKPIGWKQDKNFGGGGVLFDLGSHILDLMYHLLGEYSSIFADTTILYDKRPDKNGNIVDIEADDHAIMIVKMKSGCTGIVEASKISTGTNDELRFEIHGDKGSIRFNLMEPNWLEFYDNTLPERELGGERGYKKIDCVQRYAKPGSSFPGPKFSTGWIRSHVHCLYSFLDCVYNNKTASPSFDDGAYIQNVMEKAYLSAKQKTWVDV